MGVVLVSRRLMSKRERERERETRKMGERRIYLASMDHFPEKKKRIFLLHEADSGGFLRFYYLESRSIILLFEEVDCIRGIRWRNKDGQITVVSRRRRRRRWKDRRKKENKFLPHSPNDTNRLPLPSHGPLRAKNGPALDTLPANSIIVSPFLP